MHGFLKSFEFTTPTLKNTQEECLPNAGDVCFLKIYNL